MVTFKVFISIVILLSLDGKSKYESQKSENFLVLYFVSNFPFTI